MLISPKFSNNEIKENNIEENKDKCDDLNLNPYYHSAVKSPSESTKSPSIN